MRSDTRSLRTRVAERVCDESGISSTEMAVVMPVLIALVLMPIQFALWWHGEQAADTAVEEALDAAQVVGASEADGVAGARAILDRAGNLKNINIDVQINGNVVIVEIRAEAGYQIIPGSWGVYARAEGRVEEFLGETER